MGAGRKEKNMRSKIALLLAFTFMLSIIPTNAFAQTWGGPWGNRTGILWESGGPATNVRHWAPGVLVGRHDAITAVANHPDNVDSQGRRFIATAGGNMRHIVAVSDYFFNQPGVPIASVRMEINNVASWLASLAGGPDEQFWYPTAPVGVASPIMGRTEGTGQSLETWFRDVYGDVTLTTSQAALYAQMNSVFYDNRGNARDIAFIDWEYHNPYFGVMVVIESDTVAHLVLMRQGDGWETFANPQVFIPVPIEYVTNGDTNSYPVYLTFQERSGWPQAGEAGRRTNLTTNQPARFNFTLETDVRTFHRYGRAELQPIRVAEAVHGAFDQRHWYVELNIVTPGFFWTNASIENMGFETRFGDVATSIGQPTLLTNVQRSPDRGNNRFRTLSFALDLPNAGSANRFVNDWFDITGLSISADDRARPGDVEVEVVLRRPGQETAPAPNPWWTWSWLPTTITPPEDGATAPGTLVNPPWQFVDQLVAAQGGQVRVYRTTGNVLTTTPTTNGTDNTHVGTFIAHLNQPTSQQVGWRAGAIVYDGRLVVARFGLIGLELVLHEDDDANDHWLRSGMRDWTFDLHEYGIGRRAIGAVNPSSVNPDYHRTARAVLRETVPGSLPATGAHPTTFTFNEGIQILGARMWTNDANFSAGHNDEEDTIWFGDVFFEADNFLNATISRNSITIRPEIGETVTRRNRVAEIDIEFYLSVQPEYEGLYGDEIEVTVTSGTIETPFEGNLVVAHAWDPIIVNTSPKVLDETTEAAFGLVRNQPINDVVIEEVESGVLVPGTRIWLGVEGGVSRGWGSADQISIGAREVRVEGDSQMQVSRPRLDSHGVYVEILRGSRNDGARIIFSDVEISGRVLPGHTYNIIVADNAVADNWNEFVWLREDLGVGVSRGSVHGFFTAEPYSTPAFTFEGSDIFLNRPPEVAPPEITVPGRSVTLFESMNHTTREGHQLTAPLFLLLPNIENNNFHTSYVMMRVVADILGLEWYWNPETQQATFTDGITEVVFRHNSSTALVNGVPTEIRASGLRADSRIINDRFFVPIAFFRYIFNANVTWNAHNRTVTVTER